MAIIRGFEPRHPGSIPGAPANLCEADKFERQDGPKLKQSLAPTTVSRFKPHFFMDTRPNG